MFNNDFFDNWLDKKSVEIVEKIANGEEIKSEEMIILILKAQTNHFHHLDAEIREEINEVKQRFEQTDQKIALLREEMDKRFEQTDQKITLLREEMDKRFEQVDKRFEQNEQAIALLREDMDKRFEQVDKRFEQVDKRFEDMLKRMDRFMFWSLGLVSASTFVIIKFLS